MTRYEFFELSLTTRACALLLDMLGGPDDILFDPELSNLQSELRARLQRRDLDPKCPKNLPEGDWMDV